MSHYFLRLPSDTGNQPLLPTLDRPNIIQSSLPTEGIPNIIDGSAITGGQYSILHGIVPVQDGTVQHTHSLNEELYYVLGGELTFQQGNQGIVAPTGSSLYIPTGQLHAFNNLGTTPGELLLLMTPPGLEKFLAQLGPQGTDQYYKNLVSLGPQYSTLR